MSLPNAPAFRCANVTEKRIMRLHTQLPVLALLLTAAIPAQLQLVRGDVDAVQGTNIFRLECTNIRLVSQTVNLQALHDASRQQDIEYEMQVRDVSQGGETVLDVVTAKTIPEIFSMGNIRLGRSDTWELFGTPGSAAGMFVTLPAFTSYVPLGPAGAWLVGSQSLIFASGTVNAIGQFQVRFEPPNDPGLVGMVVFGQGVLVQNGALLLANPDCKEVRSR